MSILARSNADESPVEIFRAYALSRDLTETEGEGSPLAQPASRECR